MKAGCRIGALWGAAAVGEMGVCVKGDWGTWGKVCACGYSQNQEIWRRAWGAFWEMQGSFHLFIQQKLTTDDFLWAWPCPVQC